MPNFMTRTLALLRGINVGGKHLIKMTALKASFEALGLKNVETYIQSGNVVFSGRVTAARLEAALHKEYGHAVPVTLRTAAQLRAVIDGAPKGFGAAPEKYRSMVLFTFASLTVEQLLAQLELREGVDEAWAGPGVVYHARLEARATSSKLTKLIALPVYQRVTLRNWNTTTKLADLAIHQRKTLA